MKFRTILGTSAGHRLHQSVPVRTLATYGSTSVNAPLFTVREVRLYERDVHLRMPFRFGVVTLTEAPQCFVSVRIELADGRSQWGAAAEMLAPKWFDKNLALSNADNFDQLRLGLRLEAGTYMDGTARTAFEHLDT